MSEECGVGGCGHWRGTDGRWSGALRDMHSKRRGKRRSGDLVGVCSSFDTEFVLRGAMEIFHICADLATQTFTRKSQVTIQLSITIFGRRDKQRVESRSRRCHIRKIEPISSEETKNASVSGSYIPPRKRYRNPSHQYIPSKSDPIRKAP